MLSVKSVNALAHYTDWIVAHVHTGALSWNGFLTFGMIYWLAPRLFQTSLYSKKLAEWHFWIATVGVILYIVSIYSAGVTQGLMWRAFDETGRLQYPDFVETVARLMPMYWTRVVGGTLYISGLLLFALQVGLAGGWWLLANWTLGVGMVAGFLLWLLILSLVAMASSAYVKWRIVAGAVSLAVFFILSGVSEMIDEVFRVTWGHVLDPAWAVNRVWCTLLGVDPPEGPGFGASITALAAFILLLVVVIERKLRPVEVVR